MSRPPKDQRRHILGLLADSPAGLTARQIAAQRGVTGDHHDADALLLSMEADGLAEYSPSTFQYTITNRGRAMRFSKRNPTITTGAGIGHPGRVLVDAPAPVASMEAQREALMVEMEGPHAIARHTVRADAILATALETAIEQGMPPVDLSTMPRFKREQAIHDAVTSWARGTAGGPCGVCGCTVARTGYIPRGHTEEPSIPSFSNGKCDFCREVLRHMPPERLKTIMLGAIVGIRHMNGSNAGVPFYDEVKQHPFIRPSPTPWAFLPPALVDGIMRALDLPRWCFVTTTREQILNSFDGITAPLHTEATLPPVKPVPQVFMDRPDLTALERQWQKHLQQRADAKARRAKERADTFELVTHDGLDWRDRARASVR